MGTPLADAFIQNRPEAEALDREVLEQALAARLREARHCLPDVKIDPSLFAATIAMHPNAAALDEVTADAAADIALSLACAAHDAPALRRFDAIVREVTPGALASMKLPPARVDEVLQRVRERLLVAKEGEQARIVRYAARGALRGLVTVVASRIAIETTRDDQRTLRTRASQSELDRDADSPELMLVKAEYRAAFRDAYRAALQELDAHDKNLLRLHLVGGLTLAELATMYGQHRATVVRNLARIRETILRSTEAALKKTLKLRPAELASVWGLVRSQLDVSVMSLLDGNGEPPLGT